MIHPTKLDRLRLAYVAGLLALLAFVQIRAQVGQFAAGFRPFARAPARVAYSWDMFAIHMSRCAVSWDPPLAIDGRSVATWRDRLWPIEFDSVYDDVGAYDNAARAACAYRSSPSTEAKLECYLANGGVDEHSFACP
ncbi:MAG: hypothetical protein FWD17_17245 [Polyangiaceae bacterium]|nr:hypothetical protein [Polyangiaceae bacterium]